MDMKKLILAFTTLTFSGIEILWSPITNFYYELFQSSNNIVPLRSNFLNSTSEGDLLGTVLIIQLTSLFVTIFTILTLDIGKAHKILLVILLIILVVIVGFALYFIFSIRNGIGF